MQKDPDAHNENLSAKVIPFIRTKPFAARRPLEQGVINTPASMTSHERYEQNAREVKESPLRVLFIRAADDNVSQEDIKRCVHGFLGKILDSDAVQQQGVYKVELREAYVEGFMLSSKSKIQVVQPNAP